MPSHSQLGLENRITDIIATITGTTMDIGARTGATSITTRGIGDTITVPGTLARGIK